GALGESVADLGGEALDLFVEGFAVVFGLFETDVPAGSQHVVVGADRVQAGGGAEARNVLIVVGFAAPGVIRAGDAGDVVVGEFANPTADHGAERACIDEQQLTGSITSLAGALPGGALPGR